MVCCSLNNIWLFKIQIKLKPDKNCISIKKINVDFNCSIFIKSTCIKTIDRQIKNAVINSPMYYQAIRYFLLLNNKNCW